MTQRDHLESRFHRFGADVVLGVRSRPSLIDVLAREHAERDRDLERDRELGERSGDRVREHVEMCGLAADETAEGHDRLEAARSGDGRDGRRKLEAARDVELLDDRALRQSCLDRALRERARDLVVPSSANDRDASALIRISHPCGCLTRGHLAQSSPGMRTCWVSG